MIQGPGALYGRNPKQTSTSARVRENELLQIFALCEKTQAIYMIKWNDKIMKFANVKSIFPFYITFFFLKMGADDSFHSIVMTFIALQ